MRRRPAAAGGCVCCTRLLLLLLEEAATRSRAGRGRDCGVHRRRAPHGRGRVGTGSRGRCEDSASSAATAAAALGGGSRLDRPTTARARALVNSAHFRPFPTERAATLHQVVQFYLSVLFPLWEHSSELCCAERTRGKSLHRPALRDSLDSVTGLAAATAAQRSIFDGQNRTCDGGLRFRQHRESPHAELHWPHR